MSQPVSQGASPELWDSWANVAFANGFLEDLLPTIGKRPFTKNWTKTNATDADIEQWRQAQHNIGIRASYLRSIDIDIPDDALATRIVAFIRMLYPMPIRYRRGTGKCLLAFCMAGNFDKLSFKTVGGSVEFLANKQQFVVAGVHPDLTEYQWQGGIPDSFPELSQAEFESLWSELQTNFATAPQNDTLSPLPPARIITDDVADYLRRSNLITKESDGKLHLTHCPWEDEHSDKQTLPTQTTYFVAHTNGYAHGHWQCMHEHCRNRTDRDFELATGYVHNDFETLPLTPENLIQNDKLFPNDSEKPIRYIPIPWDAYASLPAPEWIIKDILPQAELCVIYGASGSGKTFMVLDMAFAIARGIAWRNHETRKGKVVYLCAEDQGGVSLRIQGYKRKHEITGPDALLTVIPDVPNLLMKDDTLALARGILTQGKVDVIIIDTFAQVTAGGNENSGEDMGKALAHCKGLHAATGALIVLIHHAGKDESKGARGWSGIRAAADAELEVFRAGAGNGARVTKMKNGVDNESWGFKLIPIDIADPMGLQATKTCYVEYLDASPARNQRVEKRGCWQECVVKAFDELGGVPNLDVTIINQAIRTMPGDAFRKRAQAKRALENLVKDDYFKCESNVISREL